MAAVLPAGTGGDGGNGGFGGKKSDDLFERTKKDHRTNPPSTDSEQSSDGDDEDPTLQKPKREQRVKWTAENDCKLLVLGIGRDIRPKEFERIAADYHGSAVLCSSEAIYAHADFDLQRNQPESPFRNGLGSCAGRDIKCGRKSVNQRRCSASVRT